MMDSFTDFALSNLVGFLPSQDYSVIIEGSTYSFIQHRTSSFAFSVFRKQFSTLKFESKRLSFRTAIFSIFIFVEVSDFDLLQRS